MQETRTFGAEIGKVLKLMIHSLYTNKDIFLRELISNASDACDKLRYEALTAPDLLAGDAELKIRFSVDEKARTLTLSDNGIGMSREELIANLGTIARSGTQEFLGSLTGDKAKDAHLIGQFGVGFYSSFMIADKVVVVSTRAGQEGTHRWESTGEGEFTISDAEKTSRGTHITLHIREGEDDYLDAFRLKHIVQTYSDHIAFPIVFTDSEGKEEVVNKGSALWVRAKNDITPEQYHEFYRHVAHSPDEPFLTIHHKAEGKLEFTSLLFAPTLKPFDLFHPDRKRRVKLYVKRVFITDEGLDIIPHYLRFLRGVVDSEDLPLNISRETLQANPVLIKIREAVVKKVLAELKKKAESDPAAYAKFWENFGAVLKEGLCEGFTPKEQIFEICRFRSTAGDALTGLDEYVSRMKEGQDVIYYLTGERLEGLRGSPQLEGFAKRGIEVLLLSDHVDDFWVTVSQEYKGKEFKSVTRADIDLGEPDHKETPETEEQTTQLVTRLKEIYGREVSDVRTTHKLTDSAVCLAVLEGAMDIRLERFLVEQKQLPGMSSKILEINPEHPIIKALAANPADFDDIAWLLLDQARIVEGEEVSDPAAFSRRLSRFVQKSLAA